MPAKWQQGDTTCSKLDPRMVATGPIVGPTDMILKAPSRAATLVGLLGVSPRSAVENNRDANYIRPSPIEREQQRQHDVEMRR